MTVTQHILIISDAKVGTLLVFFNIGGTDNYHYLYTVTDFLEHPQLTVRLESGQHPAGMMVVKQFTSQFEIEFSVEL